MFCLHVPSIQNFLQKTFVFDGKSNKMPIILATGIIIWGILYVFDVLVMFPFHLLFTLPPPSLLGDVFANSFYFPLKLQQIINI